MIKKELRARYPNDNKSFWDAYIPMWQDRLRLNSNSSNLDDLGNEHGFSELNGSPNFPFGCPKGINSFCFDSTELKRVIMFTDGIAPFEKLSDTTTIAKEIFTLLDNGSSLSDIVSQIRNQTDWLEHGISRPEVSIVLVEY